MADEYTKKGGLKMSKVLIVVDMQNDFISGSLMNPSAQKITKKIADYIEKFDGCIIVTQDTHYKDYLQTYEGKNLPIEHCLYRSWGWELNDEIKMALNKNRNVLTMCKETFGDAENIVCSMIECEEENIDQIEFVGTVTEICVISNVLGLKPYFPNADFIVHADMCAGLTEEGHKSALNVMKSCQVKVVGE